MAFLSDQERGLSKYKDLYPHIGPGTYETSPPTSKTRSFAPFSSVVKR